MGEVAATAYLPASHPHDFNGHIVQGSAPENTNYPSPDEVSTFPGNVSSRYEMQPGNGQAFDPGLTHKVDINPGLSVPALGNDSVPIVIKREEKTNPANLNLAKVSAPRSMAKPSAKFCGVSKSKATTSASKRTSYLNKNY